MVTLRVGITYQTVNIFATNVLTTIIVGVFIYFQSIFNYPFPSPYFLILKTTLVFQAITSSLQTLVSDKTILKLILVIRKYHISIILYS